MKAKRTLAINTVLGKICQHSCSAQRNYGTKSINSQYIFYGNSSHSWRCIFFSLLKFFSCQWLQQNNDAISYDCSFRTVDFIFDVLRAAINFILFWNCNFINKSERELYSSQTLAWINFMLLKMFSPFKNALATKTVPYHINIHPCHNLKCVQFLNTMNVHVSVCVLAEIRLPQK